MAGFAQKIQQRAHSALNGHTLAESGAQEPNITSLNCTDANRINRVMPDGGEDSGAHRYQNQRRAYGARRSRLGILICVEFLAFIPFTAITERALRPLFPAGDTAFLAAFLMFGALYLFTGSRLCSFPCPRCGENFFGGFFAAPRTLLGRNCANCGLRKYEGE
jgi:hypothetical protein